MDAACRDLIVSVGSSDQRLPSPGYGSIRFPMVHSIDVHGSVSHSHIGRREDPGPDTERPRGPNGSNSLSPPDGSFTRLLSTPEPCRNLLDAPLSTTTPRAASDCWTQKDYLLRLQIQNVPSRLRNPFCCWAPWLRPHMINQRNADWGRC